MINKKIENSSEKSELLMSEYMNQMEANYDCVAFGHHNDHHSNSGNHTNNPGTGWYHHSTPSWERRYDDVANDD